MCLELLSRGERGVVVRFLVTRRVASHGSWLDRRDLDQEGGEIVAIHGDGQDNTPCPVTLEIINYAS